MERQKHETEVQEVHFSNTTILLRLCAMRTDVINDNQDSFSFVDKTGPTFTTDVKSNTEWNMKGSS